MSVENELEQEIDTTAIDGDAPETAEEQEESPPTAEGEEGAGDDAPEQPAKPERTFTQAELDEILQRRLAKEQRRLTKQAQLEAENRILREQVQPKAPEDTAPTLEQFDGDYERYNQAVVQYQVRQEFRQAEQRRQQEAQQIQAQTRMQGFFQKGTEKYDDFEELIRDPANPVTIPMREYGETAELGVDVAFYLANNHQEAKRIAALPSAYEQYRALDAIAAKLKEPPKPSAAPEPIRPSRQTATTVKPLAEIEDTQDFVKRRREQIKLRRR